MLAARLHDPLDIRVESVPKARKPAADEVRVLVSHAGICGSDIHNFKTGQWISRRPSIAGHELSGWVETMGANVTDLDISDPVVADSRVWCGACKNCRAGRANLCENLGFIGEVVDGAFAQYITLPARLLIKCARDIPMDTASLAEPLAVALHGLRKMAVPDSEPLLIAGCGPIGALSAVASMLTSPRPVLVADINLQRLAMVARISGADQIILDKLDHADNPTGQPIRYAMDTTGNVQVMGFLLSNLAGGGKLGLIGIGEGALELDPIKLIENEIGIIGCHAFQNEMPEALQMLDKHAQAFAAIIGSKIKVSRIPEAYEMALSGRSPAIKTVIEFAASAPLSPGHG